MAQSGMTGFWKLSVPYGGLNYTELKQTGETVATVGGRLMTGTLHDGKLHLQSGHDPNAPVMEATVEGDTFPATRANHTASGWGGNRCVGASHTR